MGKVLLKDSRLIAPNQEPFSFSRPDQNAHRLHNSAEKLLMPPFPEDRFIEAVKQVVAANHQYVPPYGTGATLYLRPMLIGVGPNIGVAPAKEYIFDVFAMPVGPYFKGGMVRPSLWWPINMTVLLTTAPVRLKSVELCGLATSRKVCP